MNGCASKRNICSQSRTMALKRHELHQECEPVSVGQTFAAGSAFQPFSLNRWLRSSSNLSHLAWRMLLRSSYA